MARVLITHVVDFDRIKRIFEKCKKEDCQTKFVWEDFVRTEIIEAFGFIHRDLENDTKAVRFENVKNDQSKEIKEIIKNLFDEMKKSECWIRSENDKIEFEKTEKYIFEKFNEAYMIDKTLFYELTRYGKIKADFEVKDASDRYFRVLVFEYQDKKYFTIMCDGEPLRCEEV